MFKIRIDKFHPFRFQGKTLYSYVDGVKENALKVSDTVFITLFVAFTDVCKLFGIIGKKVIQLKQSSSCNYVQLYEDRRTYGRNCPRLICLLIRSFTRTEFIPYKVLVSFK